MENTESSFESTNLVPGPAKQYIGFIDKSENDKLRENMFRSPLEKLHLFTQMLRRESVLKNSKIIKP
ncbi:MAG: hypothetical protein ABJA35_04785 [Parafilimonas sp.]